jgi:hypothetical protein
MCSVPPCAFMVSNQPCRSPYEVLGISQGEQDPNVIEAAALRCSNHARAYQLTCELRSTFRLNEIGLALNTLLERVRLRNYDRRLESCSKAVQERSPYCGRETPDLCREQRAPPMAMENSVLVRIGALGACDVSLVYVRRVSPSVGRVRGNAASRC